MKRLQIMIERDLDAELGRRALAERTSKAALIRRLVREGLKPVTPLESDSLWQLAGLDEFEPGGVDDTVYR